MPSHMAVMRFFRCARVPSSTVRRVPSMRTSSGTMFAAVPPFIAPNVMTAWSFGSSSRAMRFCAPWKMWHAMLNGSTSWLGREPWPPLPCTTMSMSSMEEKPVPGRVATSPRWKSNGMRWMAAAASTCGSSSTPALIMASLPQISSGAVPSSSGWNMSFTQPSSSASCALRMRAAPSSMAVCASWPHACMKPFWEAKGSPVSSRRGSASMSARSMKQRPRDGSPMVVTRPPGTISFGSRPISRSRSAT